jgi:hypothetical protein
MRRVAKLACCAAVLLALALIVAPSGAVELDPAAVVFKHPDQIPWHDNSKYPGLKEAVLYGDPDKPGLYVVIVKWLPGNMSRPHWHPNDRVITVVKGTWWVGSGATFDRDATVPMPAGSVVTHYGRHVHYDGAKDEETILVITGEGPATSNPFFPGERIPPKSSAQ